MLTQNARHRLMQKIFWRPAMAPLVRVMIRYERMFDVVVRNYSLIGETNGERWLLTLLDEKPTVFDVGFHEGSSTREVLKARPGAKVIAFDPSAFARGRYEKDFANDGRVTFRNIGLSDREGEVEFFDYENMCNSLVARKDMAAEATAKYKVPISTVDRYCRQEGIERINFLKIDAEGFDLNVLEGAREQLAAQAIDIFMFEFASGWASSKRYLWEVCDYFKPLPYRLYRLFNGFLSPLIYDTKIDSCCTLSTMYVGLSERRLTRGDIPIRHYDF